MNTSLSRLLLLGLIFTAVVPAISPAQTDPSALKDVSKTSVDEKLRSATGFLSEMDILVKEVSKMLEDAESDKDEVRVTCLEKKLTTMRLMHQVAQGSQKTLVDAAQKGKSAMVDTSYRQISVMHAKILQYRAEADACVGNKGEQPGSTAVRLVESGLTSDEGTIEPLTEEDSIVDQPPPVSQFE